MADVYSDQQALQQAGRFVDRGSYGQPGVDNLDTYTAAALASGQVIGCVTPPKGSAFKGGNLTFAALGTGVTLSVGVGADGSGNAAQPALFANAVDAHAAGSASLAPGSNVANGYVFDGQTPVIITVGGNAATGLIKLLTSFFQTQ